MTRRSVSVGGDSSEFLDRADKPLNTSALPVECTIKRSGDLLIDPIHRHKLDTVQKSICQCLKGNGQVVER